MATTVGAKVLILSASLLLLIVLPVVINTSKPVRGGSYLETSYSEHPITVEPNLSQFFFQDNQVILKAVVDLGFENYGDAINTKYKSGSTAFHFTSSYYSDSLSFEKNVVALLVITFSGVPDLNFKNAYFKLSVDANSFININPDSLEIKLSNMNGSSIEHSQLRDGSLIHTVVPFDQFIQEQDKSLKFFILGKKELLIRPTRNPETILIDYKKESIHQDSTRKVTFNFFTFPFEYNISFPQLGLDNYYNNFCVGGFVTTLLDVLDWKSSRDLEISNGIAWEYKNFKRDAFGNAISDFSFMDVDIYSNYKNEMYLQKTPPSNVQTKLLLNKKTQLKLILKDVNFKQTMFKTVDSDGWKGQVQKGKFISYKIPYQFTKHVNDIFLSCIPTSKDSIIHLSISHFQNDNNTLCKENESQKAIITQNEIVLKIIPDSNSGFNKDDLYYFNIFVGCLTEECSFHLHFTEKEEYVKTFMVSNLEAKALSKYLPKVVAPNETNGFSVALSVMGVAILVESIALIFIGIVQISICRRMKQSNHLVKGATLLQDELDYKKV